MKFPGQLFSLSSSLSHFLLSLFLSLTSGRGLILGYKSPISSLLSHPRSHLSLSHSFLSLPPSLSLAEVSAERHRIELTSATSVGWRGEPS